MAEVFAFLAAQRAPRRGDGTVVRLEDGEACPCEGNGPSVRWSRDAAGRWRRSERFETNFVDLADDGGLLGQAAGRTGAAVVAWLDARGEDWRPG